MSSLNKVQLIGRLGADPESKYLQSGSVVTSMRVATNEYFTRGGEKQERTEWHRIVVWGKLAETCGKYLSKGRLVYIEGRLQNRSWDDRDGNKRYTTEIVARNVQFLDAPRNGGGESAQAELPLDNSTEDVPF